MYIHQRWGAWKPLAAFLVILAFLNLLVARNFVSAFEGFVESYESWLTDNLAAARPSDLAIPLAHPSDQ